MLYALQGIYSHSVHVNICYVVSLLRAEISVSVSVKALHVFPEHCIRKVSAVDGYTFSCAVIGRKS